MKIKDLACYDSHGRRTKQTLSGNISSSETAHRLSAQNGYMPVEIKEVVSKPCSVSSLPIWQLLRE
jgi:hypothetical protein